MKELIHSPPLHCSHATWTVKNELIHSLLFTLQNSGDRKMQLETKKEKEKGKSRLPYAVFSPLMVVLLLSTVTQGYSCDSDKEDRRWCSFFFLRWPLLNLSFSFLFHLPTLLSVLEKTEVSFCLQSLTFLFLLNLMCSLNLWWVTRSRITRPPLIVMLNPASAEATVKHSNFFCFYIYSSINYSDLGTFWAISLHS